MQRVGLQPARYKEAAAYRRYRDMKRHDISISLLGYDMITNQMTSVGLAFKKTRISRLFVILFRFPTVVSPQIENILSQ